MNRMKSIALAISLWPAVAIAQTAPAPSAAPAVTGVLLGTGLNVTDYDRSLKFYTEGLGMTLVASIGSPEHRETFLGFDKDPAKPRLMLLSGKEAAAASGGKSGGFGRVVFRVSDVAALRTRLLAAGYKADPLNGSPTGYQVLIVYDPDGYRLEFVTPGPAKP